MTDSLFKLLTGVVLGIFLSVLFKGCGKPETTPVGKPTVVHTTTTRYLPSKVVYKTQVIPKLVYTRPGVIYLPSGKTIPDTVYKHYPKDSLIALLAHRTYQDSVTLTKGIRIGYRATTHGKLDSLHLGITDTRPIKVIHDSTTITQQVESTRWKLGVGATISPTSLSPGIQLGRGRHSFQGTYNLLPSTPTIPQGRIGIGYFYTLRR